MLGSSETTVHLHHTKNSNIAESSSVNIYCHEQHEFHKMYFFKYKWHLMFIGPCIIVVSDEWKKNQLDVTC